MIAQAHRRPLVTVSPALVPPLGAMLGPALATVLAMVTAVFAMLTTVRLRLAPLGLALALRRPLGALCALLAAMAAMLLLALAALRAFAALVAAMPAFLGTPRTTFGSMTTTPFCAMAVPFCAMPFCAMPFCTMLDGVLFVLAGMLDALGVPFGNALFFRPLRARPALPALARRPCPFDATATSAAPPATTPVRFLESHELDAGHLDARDGVADQLLDRLHEVALGW